jgi:hypothetical protein
VLPEIALKILGILNCLSCFRLPPGDSLPNRQSVTQFEQDVNMIGHDGCSQNPPLIFGMPILQDFQRGLASCGASQPRLPVQCYQRDKILSTGD